jgi:hypothetical protein
VLEASQIRKFYLQSFHAQDWHQQWKGLWCKQFKIKLHNGKFLTLNKLKSRLKFRSLKQYLIKFTPLHVYQSVLTWLNPNHISNKSKIRSALPLNSEYVVDVNTFHRYKTHRHISEPEGICLGCLQFAKELTDEILDVIEENYSQTRLVFSGHRGFHIHVLDFDVRDHTIYLPKNPLKSHKVARFLYTEQLKKRVPDCFDGPHFISSSDVSRVITVPSSLNGRTGLIASYLGNRDDFRNLSVEEIVRTSRYQKHVINSHMNHWKNPCFNLLNAFSEPFQSDVL